MLHVWQPRLTCDECRAKAARALEQLARAAVCVLLVKRSHLTTQATLIGLSGFELTEATGEVSGMRTDQCG